VTIAAELASRAIAPLTPAEQSQLRTLTLFNVAALVGKKGRVGTLLNSLPLPDDINSRAFLWASRMHSRTQDDFMPSGRVHVGAVTLSVALALGEHVGSELLECLAAGYRTVGAVAGVYGSVAQRRGLRPTGVFGPVGAAAVAARAFKMDAAETAAAIGLAASASAGTNQAWVSGSDEWVLEVGAAARAGLEAALFVRAGAIAADEAFEGSAGWGRAYFDDAHASQLSAFLGSDSTDPIAGVACKLFPVSGIAQVATALARSAHTRLENDTIEDVTVQVSPDELAYPGSANRLNIVSRSTALMSIAFCVATMLRYGIVRLDALENPRAGGVADIMEKVRIVANPALPDGTSQLNVKTNHSEIALEGSAGDLLWPTWDRARKEIAELGERCEAPADPLESAAAELTTSQPNALRIRSELAPWVA
jgi:2-methylcitrate dehydratase PrpD